MCHDVVNCITIITLAYMYCEATVESMWHIPFYIIVRLLNYQLWVKLKLISRLNRKSYNFNFLSSMNAVELEKVKRFPVDAENKSCIWTQQSLRNSCPLISSKRLTQILPQFAYLCPFALRQSAFDQAIPRKISLGSFETYMKSLH